MSKTKKGKVTLYSSRIVSANPQVLRLLPDKQPETKKKGNVSSNSSRATSANPQVSRVLPDKQLETRKKKDVRPSTSVSVSGKAEKSKSTVSKTQKRPQSEVPWVTAKDRARKFQRDINSPSGFRYSAITSQSEAIYPLGIAYPETEDKAPSVQFTYRDILRHLYKVWEPQLCRNYRPTVEYSKERDVLYKPEKYLKQPKSRKKLRAAKAAIDMMNSFYAGSYYNPLLSYSGQNTLDVPLMYYN